MDRRAFLAATALTVLPGAAATAAATTAGAASVLARPHQLAGAGSASAAWQLRWSPSPSVDGLGGFEGVEDDRANSHPAGQPHIFGQTDTYRFNMHLVDRDTMTDRQRQEVKGMVANGGNLILLKGQTWRLTHSMFIPGSLKATTSFTHIMQTKAPGTGTLPMITMSLRRHDGVQKVELVVSGVTVGMTDLVPLQNKWIDVELEMTIGDSSPVRWVLRDRATTVIDVSRSNVDTWLDDRVRPKWGIYRSLGDTSGSLQDTYLLIRSMRAYEWSGTIPPPVKTRYEGENALISQGVVESNHTGFTGTGFVNVDNVVGSYAEWTVSAAAASVATLTFRYANGTAATRPMDLRVNGALVAAGLAFIPTPAWNDWDTRTVSNVSVPAGTSKVRLTSTTSTGGPNLDHLEVQVEAAAAEYQAENAVISGGVVESNHTGFTGSGFVNTDNAVGSNVLFNVAGPFTTITIRYANGTTTNRPMAISVDGGPASTVNFPGTGAWTTWNSVTAGATAAAGAHTIRLTSTTANGGPNLDKIILT